MNFMQAWQYHYLMLAILGGRRCTTLESFVTLQLGVSHSPRTRMSGLYLGHRFISLIGQVRPERWT